MHPQRIYSIDIFRGLTIFTMVFVNDLAGVANIPQWMKHMPADADAMTFVDVVFPAFLFIVGMAIPYAVKNRLENKEQTRREFWLHVFFRTAGLLILGVFMVNAGEMNQEANLIPKWLWNTLLYTSAVLVWNQYPRAEEKHKKYLYRGLRICGIIILLLLAVLYRKGPEGNTYMTPSWWGILGLIGWAYLISIVLYMLLKRRLAPMTGILGLLIVLVVGLMNKDLSLPWILEWLNTQTGNFSHSILSISGIVLSLVLMGKSSARSTGEKIAWMIFFGMGLFVAGYFLRPLYGISKIYATPSWSLYSAAICCFIFPLIYWIVDVKGHKNWATFLKPAGYNPLLTYILPPLFYALFGYIYLPGVFNEGTLGIIRALVFSFFILGISALLTRWRIRLHL